MQEKIKLSQLEQFLMRIADQLRKSMEESEYKEYIFGLLFLKRLSDVFEEKREELRKDYAHLDKPMQDEILEDKGTYGDTFFVPKRARWNEGWYDEENEKQVPALRDLQESIGPMLNKALTAIEEANSSVLQGIFKDRINFNKMSVDGTPVVKNADLRTLIEEFNAFPPLINRNFEFPDLLGAAYEFILKYFADSSGKKGGEFYTPSTVVRMLVKLLKVDEGMSVYDPTAGSGGMLIQSYQYLEDEGKNPKNLTLYGQDNKDPVVAICKMNMILHDIFDSHIALGDVLGDPKHTKGGKIMQFDRVIANPPFSQNYTREGMKYTERFSYGFLPENGKKADFMFVQHMLASCKDDGRVVVVMPHGVLFRGKKEQEVRTALLQKNVDVLEGVIGLPPQLFYGASIPACVMVFSKRKTDDMKGKVFFINADREYKEGKKQNALRPEDIEKISYVYLNKLPVPKYSRLVDLLEIAQNNYSLNIRKYVDNTPEPELHDVRAHLVGGVPRLEVDEVNSKFASKIRFDTFSLFNESGKTANYVYFNVRDKDEIKDKVEVSASVKEVTSTLNTNLFHWWNTARDQFSTIANDRSAPLPAVRSALMASMKEALGPVGMLDQHQIAGIFVNWWDGVKYDLKTIMQRGWDVDLIFPEASELVIAKFFSKEQGEIDALKERISQLEMNQDDLVEKALELSEYEPEEPEDGQEGKEPKHTPKLAYAALHQAISECSEKEQSEKIALEKCFSDLKDAESNLSAANATCKTLEDALNQRVELKCRGIDDIKGQLLSYITQTKDEAYKLFIQALGALDSAKISYPNKGIADMDSLQAYFDGLKKSVPSSKKLRTPEHIAALSTVERVKVLLKPIQKQQKKLATELGKLKDLLSLKETLLREIGGKITEEETKELILQKHYNIIASQLDRYTENEKRSVISACEHLFDKYFVSAEQIDKSRNEKMSALNDTLRKLKYLD